MQSPTIRRIALASCALAIFSIQPGAHAAESIGQLTDPVDVSVSPSLDILRAWIEQSHGQLTLGMEMRGVIPTSLPLPEDVQTYLWLVDTDENSATGQPHGALGSEFNVRAVIGETYGGGFVDVTGGEPGGGGGTVTVEGAVICITILLPEISNPSDFNWRCASHAQIGGAYVPGNPETVIVHSDVLPFTPAARVTVTTPLLELCPVGTVTGQLQVIIRDEDGNVLPNDEHTLIYHSTNESVATVDANGLVTAVAPPEYHWQTPYIEVWADGLMADNAAVIRVTHAELGVVHQMYPAEHISYYLPPSIEGVDLDALTRSFQVVEATDRAYEMQADGVGTVPIGGGTEYLVLDVADDPATCVCGASGSPIRLGWLWGVADNNSCYIVNVPGHRVPQWFVIFHEMGHNFTMSCNSFNMFLWGPSGDLNSAYCEGLASLAAMWSWKTILADPGGLGALAVNDMDQHFQNSASYWRQCLDDYRDAGSNYVTLDANALDGVLLEMHDTYGMKIWYDFFSTFLPAEEPIPVVMDTIEKQATWFVAAMSASTGQDLRSLFRTEYGFPVDDAAWAEILSVVLGRIGARSWQPPGAIDGPDGSRTDPDGWLASFPNPFGTATNLRFVLSRGGTVSLTIHDVRGARVATLLDGALAAGQHAVVWDGCDQRGRAVVSGAYLARLVTRSGVSERKLTLLR